MPFDDMKQQSCPEAVFQRLLKPSLEDGVRDRRALSEPDGRGKIFSYFSIFWRFLIEFSKKMKKIFFFLKILISSFFSKLFLKSFKADSVKVKETWKSLFLCKKTSEEPPENLCPMPVWCLSDACPMVDGSGKSPIWATITGRKKPFANRIREWSASGEHSASRTVAGKFFYFFQFFYVF